MAKNWYRAAAALGLLGLVSCGPNGEYTGFRLDGLDPDLRSGGINTTQAAVAATPRPQPDQRGVISYPGYQVAIARQGDTVTSISSRLGLNAGQVARYNAIDANTVLNAGAVVALPVRVAAGAPASAVGGTGAVRDPFAGQGVQSRTLPEPAPAAQNAPQPQQHVVVSGETAWSIARKYNVTVNDLAQWNGLPSNMAIRPGQRLLIPVAGAAPQRAATASTAPGAGSPTPQPPSASQALPAERTEPAAKPVATPAGPDLGSTRTAASGGGQFRMPVSGSIARPYQRGRNEGIDIAASPGATVSAAGAGTVAAITRDVDQVPIVVVRHEGNLMTVYAGIDDVAVSKGQAVQAGTPLGKARGQGLVHFEVRNGFDSVDPERYLN